MHFFPSAVKVGDVGFSWRHELFLEQPPLTLFLTTNILMQMLKHAEKLDCTMRTIHPPPRFYNELFAVFYHMSICLSLFSIPINPSYFLMNFKISCNISILYHNHFSMHNFYLEFNFVLWSLGTVLYTFYHFLIFFFIRVVFLECLF